MADKSKIKKTDVRPYNPTSDYYKLLIKELIRLDIPILEIGSSSIGKSYSIRQFADECGVDYEFLFVGTEKSEFIEGIPNLKGLSEDAEKFEYLKPYWFPNKDDIRAELKKGKNDLEQLVNSDSNIREYYERAFSDGGNYQYLILLKKALLKYKRSDKKKVETESAGKRERKISKYIYASSLLYISTIEGYGNFWLILDEIDKVEKQDKDKYAPLLHIVRERELKGWKLSGLRSYPEYDVKYVNDVSIRKERIDAALLDENIDVTDTRIIAIANDLRTMEKESPALYRRFIKIIIRNSLYDKKTPQLPEGNASIPVGYDWGALYDVEKNVLHDCISKKEIPVTQRDVQDALNLKPGTAAALPTATVDKLMTVIPEELTGKKLKELNLQWTLGFLPDLLFPNQAYLQNIIDVYLTGEIPKGKEQKNNTIINLLIEDFNRQNDPYETLITKIIQDNFSDEFLKPLLECIHDLINIEQQKAKVPTTADTADSWYEEINLTPNKFDNPNMEDVESKIAKKYAAKGRSIIKRYEELGAKEEKGAAGVAESLPKLSIDYIVLGADLIRKSLKENKPTKLTSLLVSSIPFIQTKFIADPNIANDGVQQLIVSQESQFKDIVSKISNLPIDSEDAAKTFNEIEPYRPFVVKYGLGVPDLYAGAVAEQDYNSLKSNIVEIVNEIISNKPIMTDTGITNLLAKEDKLKVKYYNSISNVKIIDKEIFSNLADIYALIENTYKKDNGLSAVLKRDIDFYVEKYPNGMRVLSSSPKAIAALKDYIISKADEVESNPENYNISEIDIANKI
jgi:hypothetical protein